MEKKSKKVVCIGAVALGSKAACRLKRLEPDADVTLIDKDEFISYGGCGIPYYISGDVSELTELQTTSFHMKRDQKFFHDVKGIKVLAGTEATRIDRDSKRVFYKNKDEEGSIDYDLLVIGTGSTPRKLDIPGAELSNVHYVSNLHDASAVKDMMIKGEAGEAVIVGCGFIGLELAEALTDMWGVETSMVETCPQIMPGFVGKTFADLAMNHMAENGVTFYLGEKVESFEVDRHVTGVVTNKRTVPADLVIVAVGITPNTSLAKQAGLEIDSKGGIVVNEFMETSDPNIFAGGDCIQVKNLVSGKPAYYPLGSLANRQGRVIGTNLALAGNAGEKGKDSLEGAVGSFVVKLFERSLAGAGLTLDTAIKEGFDAVSVKMAQLDRAHFLPDKEMMFLELVVEKTTRKVLGIQGFGVMGDAVVGRINAVAGLIAKNAVVSDISNLELAYSPPFSTAMDIVNALGNTAENFLDENYVPIELEELTELWNSREEIREKVCFLDCRELDNAKSFLEKFPNDWINIPQGEIRKRIEEVPKDKMIYILCNTGVRAYEAQISLRSRGLENSRVLEGGIALWKNAGRDIIAQD